MLARKGEKICSKVVIRNNFFSRGIGLMLHKPIKDEAHIFVVNKPKKIVITMFFMLFSIDIIFLDKDKKVSEIFVCAKPWTNIYPEKKAQYVIEVPKGTVSEYKIRIGERLEF